MKAESITASQFIPAISAELKKIDSIKAPEWAQFVKTGMHKERPPVQKDWWYLRTAAVLVSVAKLGPIGVSKLRSKYGGRKNNGDAPEHTYKGSGSIIRKSLQQLESAGLIEKRPSGVHKGKVVSNKGAEFLNSVIKSFSK